jgi:hypothetical protein
MITISRIILPVKIIVVELAVLLKQLPKKVHVPTPKIVSIGLSDAQLRNKNPKVFLWMTSATVPDSNKT